MFKIRTRFCGLFLFVVVLVLPLFIHLLLAVLCLFCCMWDFSSCGELGLFSALCGLLSAVASLVRIPGSGVRAQ